MAKSKKQQELEQQVGELTADLKRVRADFENYRKRVDEEKTAALTNGSERATIQMLPIIDNIERAILHIPEDINEHPWVKGIGGLIKQLDKTLSELGVSRIDSKPGAAFDPERHQAIQFDEDAEGEHEVIAEELQPGYALNSRVIRPAMVRVTRK